MKKKKRAKRIAILFWLIITIILLIYNPLSARAMTVTTAIAHNIDIEIFFRIIATESSFNTLALSRRKAVGLGQVKKSTAQYIYPNYVSGMLWFPPTNLYIAAIYYKYLLNKYQGNHSIALAAYNWGETNVDNRLRESEVKPIDQGYDYREYFRNIPETYHYIKSVLGEL